MRWGRSQTGAPSIVFGVGAEAGFYGGLAEVGFGVFVVFEARMEPSMPAVFYFTDYA